MSSTPFMPLWVSDFLGDTLDLDATEIGAYMLLLMAQWNRDGESLPADDKKLQRVARCGRNWPKVWGNIERFFKADEQGVYSKRLRLEAQNVAAKREVNKHNGGRGGKAKALKTNNVDLANATETLERNPSIPEPEPYKKESTNVLLSEQPPAIDEISKSVSAYNITAERTGWPKVQKLTKPRRAALTARIKEAGGSDGWDLALSKAEGSPFLTGQTPKPFFASFDFLTNASNFTKLMEGNYDQRNSNNLHGHGAGSQAGERIDPALERIARLAGVVQTPGDGGL
jgi:uncharacterized protein YdaU (DUF1376 family)